jgi:hypothetical protein
MNSVFWDITASVIRVTRIGELGTTLAVTSSQTVLRRNTKSPARRFLSPWLWRRYVPPKHPFLQEPHGVTSQKTPFFKVTTVKTSVLTIDLFCLMRHGPLRKLHSSISFDVTCMFVAAVSLPNRCLLKTAVNMQTRRLAEGFMKCAIEMDWVTITFVQWALDNPMSGNPDRNMNMQNSLDSGVLTLKDTWDLGANWMKACGL